MFGRKGETVGQTRFHGSPDCYLGDWFLPSPCYHVAVGILLVRAAATTHLSKH
jgi:hypothetical protein